MSASSDYLEKKHLDHLLLRNTAAYTGETNLYIGLCTAAPEEDGSPTNEFTIGTGAYARVAVTNDETRFPQCAITGVPTKTNGTLLSFPTATTAWGTATHWAIWNVASGAGELIASGALATSFAIQIGKTPKIPIGALSLTITNGSGGGLTDYAKRKILDLTFGKTAFASPTAVHIALGTALSGETMTPWGDSNYSRQETTFAAATLGIGTSVNSSVEEFTGGGADTGGTLTHYGIWDDGSGGNQLYVGPLSSSKVVAPLDTVDLSAGACIVTFK
jgi:hypothetical protein